ncbi:rhodanese-like domain-containing protein [Paenibacillus sp. IHBB 10380]|uniref:rhodanese-like domain-containing protein n=1 Tax=Paenibacillus sp. IHBB 10380 TaxID=1566358 RepID=UPI0009E5FF64|nr:rhodanese-like domain-containing protein [Paenibacillus sp. IHBB 10380]
MNEMPIHEWEPSEVQEKLAQGEIRIIDVREDEEWESGHISEAKHIPLGTLPERYKELNLDQRTVIVCRSGARSGRACEYLAELGYEVINMTGGMLNWQGDVQYGK